MNDVKRIVVVGGGAGGLELATKLGKKFGKQHKITLVDKNYEHSWKPLLHEIATGALDESIDSVNYLAHAKNNNFDFQIGSLCFLDKEIKKIRLAAIYDENNEILVDEREINYDYLVLAIGSISNDFNIEGVKENCIFLDTIEGAKQFRLKMLNLFLKFSENQHYKEQLSIAIVGAGATGVELSAEIYNAINYLYQFGYKNLNAKSVKVSLLEAGDKILPSLSDKIINSVNKELTNLGVEILTNTQVQSANNQGLNTQKGFIEADLMVWAAGVKGAKILSELGLQTNRVNQIIVNKNLQSQDDKDIFAIGDCACFIQENGKQVPPRAQAAHQMASLCFENLQKLINNDNNLKEYKYIDYGSLVSLSNYSTIGSLMGSLTKGSMFIEGSIAKITYISLYKMHQVAIFGFIKTGLITIVGFINKIIRPKMKLH